MKPTVIMTQTQPYQNSQVNIYHIPLLETVKCPFDQQLLERTYDWLIFSSKNAVKYFLPYLQDLQVEKIAAIGIKTREFCEEQGIDVDFVPNDFSQEGFLAQFDTEPHASILLPSSAQARPKLAKELGNRGYQVEKIDLYDVVVNETSVKAVYEMTLSHKIDAITFASSSAVRALFDRYQNIQCQALHVIGMPTQKILAGYGYQGIVADTQTLDAMIDKILEKEF